ncbi:MAG TPA: GDCCVxC domain-containing (seleno)protein [Gemmatimonadaceae bacterium]|nr:GDCCVxC domain-containing (seleno)protein [Gemmatimonadaceae bacterium]
MAADVRLNSVITCPACGATADEQMPTDACQFFYECKQCRKLLRPKSGDCCVFCSYGSIRCPPVQLAKGLLWLTGKLRVTR